MKANELRIGNYIMKEGEVFKSTSYTTMIVERDPDQFEPIELTEEWLRKAGFKKGIKGFWFQGGMEYNPKKQILEGFGYCEIKYVHQLQNLYFALTGDELKIV